MSSRIHEIAKQYNVEPKEMLSWLKQQGFVSADTKSVSSTVSKIYYDEIFGPATVVHVVDSTDEAVALANDTPYGLTAGVITEDLAEGLEVAGRLRTGIVHVNDQSIADEPQAPFGGVKSSGLGREGSRYGIEDFIEIKYVCMGGMV